MQGNDRLFHNLGAHTLNTSNEEHHSLFCARWIAFIAAVLSARFSLGITNGKYYSEKSHFIALIKIDHKIFVALVHTLACCDHLAGVCDHLAGVVLVGQVRTTALRQLQGMRTSSIFNSQHVATLCNRLANLTQLVAPNIVAICCVELLRAFGRAFKLQ